MNIRQMFRHDLKSIFVNEGVFLLILLTLILPTIFVSFIIGANQQPMGDLEKIKVALVNKDQGGIINGIEVNIGQEIVENIKNAEGISWQIVTYETALRETLIGRYYGQIIIPEDFTNKVATLDTAQQELPKVQYDMNFQENIYAPTFNTVNNASLQASIQRSIINETNKVIKSVIGDVKLEGIEDNNLKLRQVAEAMLLLNENKNLYLKRLEEYKELSGEIIVLLSNVDNSIINSKIDRMQIERFRVELQSLLDNTIELENEYEGTTGNELGAGYKKLTVTLENIIQNLDYVKDEGLQFQDNIKTLRRVAARFYNIVDQIYDAIIELVKHTNGAESKLGFLAQGNNVEKLIYNLKNNPELVGEYLEAPMFIQRVENEDIFNENITVAPFDIGVAMWIGKVILVTLLSINFRGKLSSGKKENQMEEEFILIQEYISKGLFFIVLGIIQDFLMICVVRLVFNVGTTHPFLFLGIGLVGSITFSVMIYTAVSVFRYIGKLGIYFISILQLFLLGGVFPLQIIPDIFFRINTVMPFIYVVGSFRELQVDFVSVNLYKSVIILLIFTIYTIVFGIIGKIYLTPYIKKFYELLQKSDLFVSWNR
ncbi:YhgE/Pip domain-containing protein [Cellulosilyticum ruminicola]|uniref:YhgE/Pip domain-containing protein n=1 Tax=Cellulosilyticum ruminicola TaxID=425254 RepID=UPI0006D23779|nr:YhgE/Pip family protein [Cellulosilyticum ruminicola]